MKPVPPATTAVREAAAINGRVRRADGLDVTGARAQGRCGVKVERVEKTSVVNEVQRLWSAERVRGTSGAGQKAAGVMLVCV